MKTGIKFKGYVTKHALTAGIQFMELERCDNQIYDMATTIERYPQYLHKEGKEYHITKESAIKRAEEMRANKIESLKKSITKLENINFNI